MAEGVGGSVEGPRPGFALREENIGGKAGRGFGRGKERSSVGELALVVGASFARPVEKHYQRIEFTLGGLRGEEPIGENHVEGIHKGVALVEIAARCRERNGGERSEKECHHKPYCL